MRKYHPVKHNADNFQLTCKPQAYIPDVGYVLARPVGTPTVFDRLKLSWGVFTGKYDALEWTEQ